MATRGVKIPAGFGLLVALLVSGCAQTERDVGAGKGDSQRSVISFNSDWRFTKDDPAGTGDALSYAQLKPWMLAAAAGSKLPEGEPGDGVAYTRPEFDDGGWRQLSLP